MTLVRKKPSSVTPTRRSLKFLRERGYTVGITEHWNFFAKIRQDLFGWADAVAVHLAEQGVLFLQFTADNGGSVAARVHKILASESARVVLAADNRIEVWGWSKRGPCGEPKHWMVRRVPILLSWREGMHQGEATVER